MASVTKLFTATAIMMLYEQGKVGLTDPMARYLPRHMIQGTQVYQGHDYSAEISVEQLLAQTSGIPDYYDEKGKDGRTVFEIMEADPSHAWTEPGQDHQAGYVGEDAPVANPLEPRHALPVMTPLIPIIKVMTVLQHPNGPPDRAFHRDGRLAACNRTVDGRLPRGRF